MRALSPVLTTVFLASIVLQCYTQSTCTSGDCIFDCSQQDCTEIVCTDGADSCTILCRTNECYGSLFYLAATINTVECDGSASCKLASFFCGEPPTTAPVWARWSPASFDGHIDECTFRLSNSAMSDQGRIRCYHDIDVCQVSALTDADDFKVSQFECELSPVDAQCRMFCHDSKSCGSGTSSFACQAPECDCSGPGCSQLTQTMDTAPPSTSALGTTVFPTSAPTFSPSSSTVTPTMTPTRTPTSSPTMTPTLTPTVVTMPPTLTPTPPTIAPSDAPTMSIPILETVSPTAVTSTSVAAATTTLTSPTLIAVVSQTTTTTVTAATTAVIVEQTGTNDIAVGHGGSNDGDTSSSILLPDSVLSKISLITIGLVAMCGSLLVIVCVLRKKRKRNLEQKKKPKQATQTGHKKQALPSNTQLPAPVPRDHTAHDEAKPGAVAIAMTSTRRNDSLYTNPHRNTAAAPVNVTAEGADHAHLPVCPPHITIHHTLQPTVYQRHIRELRPQDHLQRMAQLTTGDAGGECGGDDAEAADIDRDPSICDDEKLSRCSPSHTTDAVAAAKNVITPRTLQYDEHESSDDDAAVLAVASHSKLHKRGATISHKSMQSFANSRVSMPSTPSVPSVPSMHDCLHSEVIRRQGSTDEMYGEHGHEQEEEAVHVTVDMNGVLHTQGQGPGQKSHLADVDVDIDLEEDECDEAMEDMYTSDHEQSVKTPG